MCAHNSCTCLGKMVKEDLSKEVTFKLKLEGRKGVSFGGISFLVARIANAISWRHLYKKSCHSRLGLVKKLVQL